MSVMELCHRAWINREPGAVIARWVMDRAWYDRLRAEVVPEDQERERARMHAGAIVSPEAAPSYCCPACPAGPFATMKELAGHVTAMSDPADREPAPGDVLFCLPIDVRVDGGPPHLEAPPPRANPLSVPGFH